MNMIRLSDFRKNRRVPERRRRVQVAEVCVVGLAGWLPLEAHPRWSSPRRLFENAISETNGSRI